MSSDASTRRHLQERIGNTPLTILEYATEQTGATLVAKCEYLNPTGSHYDRVMYALLTDREGKGQITPGNIRLLDVSSGNSSASLAWLARIFGYQCSIVMPGDLPYVRLKMAEKLGASLILSPEGEYIAGAIETMKNVAKQAIRDRAPFHLVNHAADTEAVPSAMRQLGREILNDFVSMNLPTPDFAVAPIGNGSSLAAFTEIKSAAGTRLVGFEAAAHPRYFVRRYGAGAFAAQTGGPATYSVSHGLLGTGPGDSTFGWPLVEAAYPLIDEIKLVTSDEWEAAGLTMTNNEFLL